MYEPFSIRFEKRNVENVPLSVLRNFHRAETNHTFLFIEFEDIPLFQS